MELLKRLNNKVMSRHIPFSCVFELTYRCNLKCEYCYNPPVSKELSYDEITCILESIADAGTMFLTLTGGEPFLRKDLLDIVKYARKKGFIVRLFTNGTHITDEAIALFQKLSGIFISISIHGKDAGTNDSFTGSNGSFDKTIKSVKKCKEAKVPVRLKCTWTKHSIPYHKEIKALAKSLGVPLSSSLTVIPPGSDGNRYQMSCQETEEKVREYLTSEYGNIIDFDDFYNRTYKDENKVAEQRGGKHLCSAGISLFRINPAGSVFPCVLMQNELGNLKDDSFKDIWSGNGFLHKLRNLKRKDVDVCKDCEDFSYCFRCPGITQLEGGDLFSKSNDACTKARLRKKVVQQLRKEVKI